MNPKFVIYTGPMFGAKTTRLVADIDRETYKGRTVIAFKASRDKRYNEDAITTHSGASFAANPVSSGEMLKERLFNIIRGKDPENVIVAVDEVFMIQGIDDALIDLFKSGFSIIASSIQLDADDNPFESVMRIMPFATKIEVCPAVCTKCDQDAYYTQALYDIQNTPHEDRVGGKEMYEPRCFRHFSNFN